MEYEIKSHIDDVHTESFFLDETILKSIDKFKDISGDITIDFQQTHLIVESDKNGLERVVDNMISNGIKYNKPKGSINIFLKDSKLYFQDTGIGINTKNLFSVFDKYFQTDQSHAGIGLGLNIVKSYCDRYKIPIQIESQIDKGTTFIFDLKNIKK